ncbi:glutathione synthetase [Holotrichia oblita]|uniref:Glutathione synthetase n=3 Tax=Holotrichia oblita TaxID=644536 RepID=A0ACB9TJ59_HOLOL|nr:glutathione synthetase [Holotrichia oblita]KAI4466787.1 glutathione synthetase [Holotrichia oblita]
MAVEIPRLPCTLPLPLSEDVLVELVDKTKDWALMHGAAMRSKSNFSKDSLNFAPFVLLPSAFPRKEFYKAVELQQILNELMHRVAHNREFLTKSLKETIQVDEFTGNLFKIYETVQDEGVIQPISLGLLRSDIMLETVCPTPGKNCPPNALYCCWKQVEINTIASGFGWLGPASALIQRFVLQELDHHEMLANLPENNALEGLCSGMLEAWKIYGDAKAAILFIIEDVTYNICDQRFHEFELRRLNPYVKVIRRTLTDMAERAKLGPDNELLIDDYVVSVVYFRAGYEPGHYHSQREWDARLLIERSQAIKSPSIHYHLAGSKKVQQALARPGAVEMFLGEASKIEAVKEIFTGLYSLDFDEFGDQAIQMALDAPERFVLKPQREGGGNNIYGKEIRDAILKMKDSRERTAWILMERINPPISTGYIVRPGGPKIPELVDLVSELGIFGVVIGDSTKIFSNRQVGHMLRTKISTANEGGVAAGLGALDSPYLID